MIKQVTMYDIAKKTNVSTVTVSKALSGQKGVGEEVRARILACADEMGYTRNIRSKKMIRPPAIGVVGAERLLSEPWSFYWRLYQAMATNALDEGCMLYLELVKQEAEEAGDLPAIVRQERVEGLIAMGEFRRPYREMLEKRAALPCVWLDAASDSGQSDAVLTDNMTGGMVMTDYLFSLGHRRIGFFGRLCQTGSIDDRFLGYAKSCFRHGVGVPMDWIVSDRDKRGTLYAPDAIRLPEKNVPTAWFCGSDRSALRLVRAFNARGLTVPKDISLVGFDNYSARARGRRLTTYEIDTAKLACQAIKILRRKMEDEHFSAGRVVMGGQLVPGDSTLRIGPEIPAV